MAYYVVKLLKEEKMAKYDDASWHYGGEYPEDLPDENGSTHIGMFLQWCIENDLASDELIEDAEDEIKKVKEHKMTGAEFLIEICDEKLTDEDLNELGNSFAEDYYDDLFPDDYCKIFGIKRGSEGSVDETFYRVENTFENYGLLKPIIDKRFEEWKEDQ